jgi:hypothetical protein
MIYEIRTYDLKPGSQPEVEKRFGEAYEKRRTFSEATAFLHTDLGPLHQLVHIWPYGDLMERARIQAAAESAGAWPPDLGGFVVRMRSDIMLPFPYSPELKPGKAGPCFEFCIDTYLSGDLPAIMQRWQAALPKRLELSPLCALWYSEVGGALYNFVHIWAYESLDRMEDVRRTANVSGIWPPAPGTGEDGGYTLLAQETKILSAAAFSPIF